MRMTEQKFHPDTCGCIINEKFDADAAGKCQLVNFERCCPAHVSISDDEERYRTVSSIETSENKRKNRFHGLVEDDLVGDYSDANDQEADTFEPDGRLAVRPGRQLKKHIRYFWRFVPGVGNRALEVCLVGIEMTPSRHARLQAIADELENVTALTPAQWLETSADA